jgi:hypothetical protein
MQKKLRYAAGSGGTLDGQTESTRSGGTAVGLNVQAEPTGLAAVLGLGRDEQDTEAIAKAEQNRRNA